MGRYNSKILRWISSPQRWFLAGEIASPVTKAVGPSIVFLLLGVTWVVALESSSLQPDAILWGFVEISTMKSMGIVAFGAMFLFYILSRNEELLYWMKLELNHRYDCLHFPVLIIDPATLQITYANKAAHKTYDIDKNCIDRNIKSICPGLSSALLHEIAASQLSSVRSVQALLPEGRSIQADLSVSYCSHKSRFILSIVIDKEASELNQQLGKIHLATEVKFQKTIERLRHENVRLTSIVSERDRINNELIYINGQLQAANRRYQDQANELLKQRDDYLSQIFSSVNDIVWSYDLVNKKFFYLSNSAAKLLGEDLNVLLEHSDLSKFVHPDDEGVRKKSRETLHATGAAELSFRVITKTGEIRWLFERVKLIRDVFGNPVRCDGIETDITYIKQTEELVLSCQATGDVIWDFDIANHTVNVSPAFDGVFDFAGGVYSEEEFMSFTHPEDREYLRESWKRFLQSDQTHWKEEYRIKHKDGRYARLVNRASTFRNEAGQPIRVIGALINQNERMRWIDEARQLSLVAKHTHNPVAICSKDFKVEWVNDAFLRSRVVTVDEVVGTFYWTLHGQPIKNNAVTKQISDLLVSGQPANGELSFLDRNGKVRWIRIDATPVWDDAGNVEKFVMIETDISRQVAYENRITSIAREFAAIIQDANAVIFGIDRNGYINEWNRLTSEITGFQKNDVLGRKLMDHIRDDEDKEKLNTMLSSVLEGKAASNIELKFRTREGKDIVLFLNATLRRDISGGVSGALVVGQEITELSEYRGSLEEKVEQRTRELNAALRKEMELAEMKKRFVSVASHEFRTPLSTISFAAGFLQKYRERLSQEQIDIKLQKIEHQVKHMTFLLDDVLTIGKSEASAIQVKPSPVNVEDFFNALTEELAAAFRDSHRVDIRYHQRKRFLYTDEKLLRNIFSNLISNAIKFSPEANLVELEVSQEQEDLLIRVSDKGIGIHPDDMAHIFEPFQRGGNVSSIQGTGLGLNIVKRSVELIGGHVTMSSVLGEGTTFQVRIPDFTIQQNTQERYEHNGWINESITG